MPKIWHIEMCILTSSNLLRLCCPSCVTLIQTASRACWNWVMWFAGNPKNTSSWWSSGCPWWLSCAATGFSCCSSHALPRRSQKMMMALSSRPAGFLAMSCPVSSRSLIFFLWKIVILRSNALENIHLLLPLNYCRHFWMTCSFNRHVFLQFVHLVGKMKHAWTEWNRNGLNFQDTWSRNGENSTKLSTKGRN